MLSCHVMHISLVCVCDALSLVLTVSEFKYRYAVGGACMLVVEVVLPELVKPALVLLGLSFHQHNVVVPLVCP